MKCHEHPRIARPPLDPPLVRHFAASRDVDLAGTQEMRKHSPAIHGAFEGLQSSVWPETPQRDRAQQNNRTGANIMNGKGEPKLIFPGLAGFYAAVSDLWYPMIRFAIGAILFM